MRRCTALFLVFSVLALSGSLFAKEKRGVGLVVQKKDGSQVSGELITVKEDSHLLLNSKGADVSVNVGDIVGLDEFKNWVTGTRTAYPDFNAVIEETIFKDDKIVSRFTVTATNTGPLTTPYGELPPTGKKVQFFGVNIIQVVNEKIIEEWLYYNQASYLQRLGFTITPPAPPEEKPKEPEK